MTKIITIVGGKGGMGRLFSSNWQKLGYTVLIIDQEDWDSADQKLKQSNLVVISVPMEYVSSVIARVCQLITHNTILADFTSIKEPIIKQMSELHLGPVLGLHPMFGPTISSSNGQVIINCGGRDIDASSWVLDSFKLMGFTLRDMTPLEHDQAMSFIQGIEHFSTFVLGSFLKQHDEHPDKLFNLASPIYQAKLTLLGRIFDQDANLYADIIMSDEARLDLIAKYAAYLQDWVTKLKGHEHSEFITEFQSIKNWMGDFTTKSQLASDMFLTEVNKSYTQ